MGAEAPVGWEGPLDSIIKALDLILSLEVEVSYQDMAHWETRARPERTRITGSIPQKRLGHF